MARTKPIRIACPQYRAIVRGVYECDGDGSAPRTRDGKYMLHRVRCGQYGGRCMQTLCVLHRYNHRGPGSWYPEIILAAPDARSRRADPHPAGPDDSDPSAESTLSIKA